MKSSINIARTELRTFFYSPIAWLVLVIFTFQCGLSITDILARLSADSNAGMWVFNLTNSVLANFAGYFATVQKTVYLYLPLLTMGLVSRELSSGSIKLVYSSPVTALELVAGKYLAMLAYCFLMTLIAMLALVPAVMTIPHFDYGLAVGGLWSTFLLIATYSAIGLFMSCLTSYQVVAAISTMVLLGGINYIGEVGKGTDILRDITGFLSVAGRGENLRDGLLTTSDLAYFLLIITFFLVITIQYLNAQQRAASFARRLLHPALLLGILTVIGVISSHPRFIGYKDLTATGQRTLSVAAQQALLSSRGPLKISTYVNILDENFWSYGSPEKRHEDEAFWAPYIRFRPDIKMEYIYYYGTLDNPLFYQNNHNLSDRQIAEKKAEAYGMSMNRVLPAEQLAVKDLLQKEGNRMVRILQAGNRSIPLRLFDNEMDANPWEQESSDALRLLTEAPVRVALLDGEAERGFMKEGDRDYNQLMTKLNYRQSLVNHGFVCSTIGAEQPIPADVDILVVADPRTAFSAARTAQLQAYIRSGGNLLLMVEPDRATVVNPVLSELGLEIKPGMVVQQSRDFSPALIRQQIQPVARLLEYPDLESAIGKEVTATGVGVLALNRSTGFSAFPILCNNPLTSWYRSSNILPDTGQVLFNTSYGDEKGTVVTAYGLKRPLKGRPEQRIIVTADADWPTTAELYRAVGPRYNPKLIRAIFKYLSNGRFPVEVTRPAQPDQTIIADKRLVFQFRLVLLGILPGLLLVAGSILLIRRRGR